MNHTLFITRTTGLGPEFFNEAGEIVFYFTGHDAIAMLTADLSIDNDSDVLEYVNHCNHEQYDQIVRASQKDATTVFEVSGEDGGKYSLAAILFASNQPDVYPFDDVNDLIGVELKQTVRLTGGVGLYYDFTRIY